MSTIAAITGLAFILEVALWFVRPRNMTPNQIGYYGLLVISTVLMFISAMLVGA